MYIVADIGGTKMRIAASRDLQSFDTPTILDTPQTYQDALTMITDTARSLAAGEHIDAMAMGVPALLSRDRRKPLSAATHIPDWVGKEVAGNIETVLGTRVYLENDTAMVGLGEATAGAGKGASIAMYLTVSTGVNGARIVDGRIDRGIFSSHIGHQYLSATSDETTWEELISGYAIERRFGKHPRELGKESPVWEELAVACAFGVHNAILHWSPERVVLGGSMFNEVGIPVDRVRFHLERITRALPELPEIVHSSLGDFGGLHGGLARLRQID